MNGMESDKALQAHLITAVEHIIQDSVKAAADNPRETAFLLSFSAAAKRAAGRRRKLERQGEHIPPFLIGSITRGCNLQCKGCFARAQTAGLCAEEKETMTGERWGRIFSEAEELGISFVFLVGGEPMLRPDVIEQAAEHPGILFPIITNGSLLQEQAIRLFDRHRNLLPILSIEGGRRSTDDRRGDGVYDQLLQMMERLQEQKLVFGVSITLTKENLKEVTESRFLAQLQQLGCKLVLYVEYAATGRDDLVLEPDDADREEMERRLAALRAAYDRMVLLSFPGDEKAYGGCLAAGRGFFHISAEGDAEPCPFAPYSDRSVRERSLREALSSPLFSCLREKDMLQEEHTGGCALNGKGAEIREMLKPADC